MRHITAAALAAITALVLGVGLSACASSSTSTSTSTGAPSTPSAAPCSNAAIQGELYTKGVLTVATDQPVYPPWFINNKPSNGMGYESAVAYAVAAQLGFAKSQVKWVYEPFNNS